MPLSEVNTNPASEKVDSTPFTSLVACCTEHCGTEMDFYCETCNKAICWRCIKKHGEHHSCNYEKINETIKKYREKVTSSLVNVNNALAQVDAHQNEVTHQQESIEANIHDTISQIQIHKILAVRTTELIDQLNQLTESKLKSLEAQKDRIGALRAKLSDLHCLMENGSQGAESRQVKELLTSTLQPMTKPNRKADMSFTALVDLAAECH